MDETAAHEHEASDEVLADRGAAGDSAALDLLVRRFLRPVQAVTAAFLSEPADVEDAVQETFLRMLRGLGGYLPTRPFAPWIYQIARNVARERLSAEGKLPTEQLPEPGLESELPGPDIVFERAEIRRLVSDAIGELPEQQRIVFRLHDVDGYPTAEIAQLMNLTEGTVRSHLHHARRALRAALAPAFIEPPGGGG